MTSASEEFIGTHDFTSFRSINCQANNPIRTIDKCYFKIEEDNFISFNITSRSFLHNQVRIMVGTLVYIGLKKYPYCIIKEMLLTKDRKSSGITAPPYGLYLTKIVY